MIIINVNLSELCKSNDHIGCLYPHVNISVDVGDNVDMQKMKQFKDSLERFMEKGLNDCLTE